MSGSVQKTIPEERILRIEREIHARKNRRRFLKNLRRLKKPGVKQPVAVAVVGQLPEAAESAAASSDLRIRIVINSSPVIVSCSYRYLAIS